MNERIKKLAEQAGYYLYDLTETHQCKTVETDSTDEWITLEKFAELIVREMCGLMEQVEDDAYHCSEPADRPTEYIEWLVSWRTQFEEHFGVEE